jgi:hypothetical protein
MEQELPAQLYSQLLVRLSPATKTHGGLEARPQGYRVCAAQTYSCFDAEKTTRSYFFKDDFASEKKQSTSGCVPELALPSENRAQRHVKLIL